MGWALWLGGWALLQASAAPALRAPPRAQAAEGFYVGAVAGPGTLLHNAAVADDGLAQGQAGASEGLRLGGQMSLLAGRAWLSVWAAELELGLQAFGSRGTPRLRGLSLANASLGLRYLLPLRAGLALSLRPRGGMGYRDTLVDPPSWGPLAALAVGLHLQPPVRHLHLSLAAEVLWSLRPQRLSLALLPGVQYTF